MFNGVLQLPAAEPGFIQYRGGDQVNGGGMLRQAAAIVAWISCGSRAADVGLRSSLNSARCDSTGMLIQSGIKVELH